MTPFRWRFVIIYSLLMGHPVSSTQELNRESFDELIASGRNGMIKIYQPWCGHCTRVKPDWDLLAEEAHPSVFIADVNCQLQGYLCADLHTGGKYPTILIFQQGEEPELYRGGRGFKDLRKFVDETLVTKCDLTRLEETCGEKEQNYASKWKERGAEAWKKEVSRLDFMTGDTMTYELSKWLKDRVRILEQFLAADPKDEL